DRDASRATLRDEEPRPRIADEGLQRAFRHPAFWGLALCFTAYYTAFSAVTFHVIPLLTERGVPTGIIVGAIAVVGPAQVLGRIVLLAFRNRADSVLAGGAAMVLFPASILLLIVLPSSTLALFAFAVLYGCANGIVTIVRGTAVPDLMWRESYGAINGALTLPANLAKAAAPVGFAFVWSASGNYDAVLWCWLGAALVAGLGFSYAGAKRVRSQ
ncbi:MAG TPA: MFS transporter, partial [Burkholderiales bacterium]|nr:MFS transporter [Burkholderiales bacterium]